jgi:GT2 family glycosyltransferase
MKVSAVIVTYNRREMLTDLIARLRGQTVPVEIVVSDDGSREPVVMGDRYLWRRDDGYHRTGMVNKGASMASGDVLLFLDDDTRPRGRMWVQSHLKVLETAQISRGPFFLGSAGEDGKFVQLSPYVFGMPGTYWSSVNTAMPKSVWDALGGYDERFDGAYGFEDIDFGLKVGKAGVRVGRALHGATVEHIGKCHCERDGRIDESIMARNKKLLEEKWGDSAGRLTEKSG